MYYIPCYFLWVETFLKPRQREKWLTKFEIIKKFTFSRNIHTNLYILYHVTFFGWRPSWSLDKKNMAHQIWNKKFIHCRNLHTNWYTLYHVTYFSLVIELVFEYIFCLWNIQLCLFRWQSWFMYNKLEGFLNNQSYIE